MKIVGIATPAPAMALVFSRPRRVKLDLDMEFLPLRKFVGGLLLRLPTGTVVQMHYPGRWENEATTAWGCTIIL